MAKFNIISEYKEKGIQIPKRATQGSAGYDLASASDEDIVIPSFLVGVGQELSETNNLAEYNLLLSEIPSLIKSKKIKPVMIPTGLNIKLAKDEFLQVQPRSSIGTKHLLVMPSSLGIIDSDYIESSNEGHIYLPFINLSPYNIIIQKGDKLAQGIIQKYIATEDDEVTETRNGGFGSTN